MADQLEFPWEDTPPSAPAAAPRAARLPQPVAAQVPDAAAERLRLAEQLRAELSRQSGIQVQLRINDNVSTMMTVRHVHGARAARLNLHHMFLDAPPAVVAALAHWVRHPRSRKHADLFNEYIRARRDRIAAKPARPARIVTDGHCHDLQRLYDEVNAEHFGGRIEAVITWGNFPSPGRRRSIRLGSYAPGDRVIRIHPHLDAAYVPEWFVRYIVFHEMLHAHLGIAELPSGRRAVHPPAFRRIEESYPDHARAAAWIDRNLSRLLRRPSGLPR